MKPSEFLQEVLSSKCCPENFNEIYKEFQKYQNKAIETLNEFHRVCEKNGVLYQLAYGSLLGAIRDGGQIPWDYDIDVFVPYSEKDKLIEALMKDLNEKFYFYCPEVDKKCRHFMMRLAPKGYNTSALHVDVFYVIGAPDDAKSQKLFSKEVLNCFNLRYYKLVNIREESMGNIKSYIKKMIFKIRYLNIPIKKLEYDFENICNKYNFKDQKYSISVDGEAGKYIFNTEKMWETTLINIDSGTFRISKDFNHILNLFYGDYKKIFPLASRINEVMSSYKRLKYFDDLLK